MSSRKLPFVAGTVVFRNTWKNHRGNIRTNLYATHKIAVMAARTQPSNLFQEIATPIFAEHCFLNPGELV